MQTSSQTHENGSILQDSRREYTGTTTHHAKEPARTKLKRMVLEADEAQLDRIVQAIYSVCSKEGDMGCVLTSSPESAV